MESAVEPGRAWLRPRNAPIRTCRAAPALVLLADGGDDRPAIRRKRREIHLVGMLQLADRFAARRVPKKNRLLIRCDREEKLSIAAKLAVEDVVGVRQPRAVRLARIGMPKLGRLVSAEREHEPRIGAEDRLDDRVFVLDEAHDRRARFGVPNLGGLVETRRDDFLAIGAERGVHDGGLMPERVPQRRPRRILHVITDAIAVHRLIGTVDDVFGERPREPDQAAEEIAAIGEPQPGRNRKLIEVLLPFAGFVFRERLGFLHWASALSAASRSSRTTCVNQMPPVTSAASAKTETAIKAAAAGRRWPARRLLKNTDRPGADRLIIQKSIQIVGQLRGTGVATGRRFLQTFQADRLDIPGNSRLQFRRRNRILTEHLKDRVGTVAAERRPAREQLVQDCSQGP